MKHILETDNFTFYYPEQEKATLTDVSLTLDAGEFVVLAGPSGCGKSTLLRQFKPSITPAGASRGDVRVNGIRTSEIPHRAEAETVGFVQQSPENQIVTDKVWHELAFGLESLGMDQVTIRTRVAEMASFFGIEKWFDKNVHELSGGQKQLLNLASVMVMQPQVLILDEPASQLDPIAAHEFLETVGRINRELGTAVLMTEHRLEEVFPLADRVLMMDGGRIISNASAAETGRILKEKGHSMFPAMPAAMRLYAALDGTGESPVTVREGHRYLADYKNTHETGEIPAETVRALGDPVITLRNVFFRYEKDLPDVLRGLDLTVQKGGFTAILGGNGTGKSTTLSVITGLLKPYRGTVRVNGRVGMLPQDPRTVFLKKTVREDLAEALPREKTQGLKRGERSNEQDEKLRQVIGLCRLENLLSRHPYDLSGGEQQRAALAKLLLTDPEILLLDEPTKGLDADFKAEFAAILKTLCRHGKTVLMVSHDVEFCAEYTDRCGLFFNGELTAENTPRTFFSGNSFYTTAVSRMARDLFPGAVTTDDVLAACGKEPEDGTHAGGLKTSDEEERDGFLSADPENVEQVTTAEKNKKLPLWRKLLGLFFGMIAAGTFVFTVTHTDLSALIGPEGMTTLAGKYMIVYAVLILSVIGMAASFAQKSKKPPRPDFVQPDRKLSRRTAFSCGLILLLVPLTIFVTIFHFGANHYYVLSVIVLLEAMAPFALVFEKRKPKPRELVVIAVLSALGAAGRTLFFMLPGFKPVIALVIVSGVAFGGETGFLTGALTMLVSNMVFGQGPWTPYQMFAMGVIGLIAGVLFKKGLLRRDPAALAVFGAFSAIVLYGGLLNPASALMWGTADTISWKLVLPYVLSGFPMDCVQAAATAVFLYFGAEPMLEKMDRVKVKYGIFSVDKQ